MNNPEYGECFASTNILKVVHFGGGYFTLEIPEGKLIAGSSLKALEIAWKAWSAGVIYGRAR